MQKRRLVIDIKGRIGIIRQDLSQLELIKSKEARIQDNRDWKGNTILG